MNWKKWFGSFYVRSIYILDINAICGLLVLANMAQLPPKVPSMTQTWPQFSPQDMPSDHNLSTNNVITSNPSWNIDEFLNFSSVRRGSHRRSSSDSVALLDPPMVEERRRASIEPNGSIMIDTSTDNIGCDEFERFDDEQLMSMFTDDVGPTMSCSNHSSPSQSDRNSMDGHDVQKLGPSSHHLKPKSEPEEVQSSCKSDELDPVHVTTDHSSEKIFDPKRIKRY